MTTPRFFTHVAFSATACLLVSVLAAGASGEDPEKADKPKSEEGIPVYLVGSRLVLLQKGSETPPKEHKGALGAMPFALIKIDGKVVGEVYATQLEGTPGEEAKGMAGSAKPGGNIELAKQGNFQDKDLQVEFVTLKLNVPSTLGKPWLVHSLYFPSAKGCATLKLTVSEERFKEVLPIFESMVLYSKQGTKPK